MKIRNLDLKSRMFLAPMLEPNDVAFRILCKRAGCGLTWTGMTSPLSRTRIDLDDEPVLQLFGNSFKGIRSFMGKYDSGVSGWDFNLGCPSKLSRKLGHGACLRDLGVIRKILETMRENTEKFLCVKIRKSEDGLEIARIAEEVGVDAVCVHARTLSQGYSGEVDYDWALEVKRAVGIPVIFSGVSRLDDVFAARGSTSSNTGVPSENPRRAGRILKDFDFVMLGRLAIGRPGVFGKVDGESGEVKKQDKQDAKDKGIVQRNKNSTQINTDSHGLEKERDERDSNFGFGEWLGLAREYGLYFRQVKYQAMNWTKGMRGGAGLRRRLVECKNEKEVRKVFGLGDDD